ncbi:uncharacterized protein LOC110153152 [Boleophthalmus pectinirostris]|uniref:uncharacterized protein LOC110153152 n=1 Tax=Boleophthalmus pectinirostris TaxID=150288 RepID=UPI00242D47AD|nr:uncharacterized protein LOC110153152 [Boleophthalmus pectinirostris]
MEHVFIIALIFLFGPPFGWAKIEDRYFKVGTKIEVRPPGDSATSFTRILWKHNENLVAEWATGEEVEFYSTYKGRTTLDTATGLLTISSTTEKDAGTYKVEINDKLLDDSYNVVSIQDVPVPHVWSKPGMGDDQRILSCEGDVSKAGPVDYYWKIGIDENGPWIKTTTDKYTLIKNETTTRIQFIYCKMVNPIGEKESSPENNPYYDPGPPVGAIVGGSMVFLTLIVIIVVVGVLQREKLKTLLCPGGDQRVENGPGAPAENVNLKTTEDGAG